MKSFLAGNTSPYGFRLIIANSESSAKRIALEIKMVKSPENLTLEDVSHEYGDTNLKELTKEGPAWLLKCDDGSKEWKVFNYAN